MICASLYRPFFIQNLLRYLAEKILLLNTTNFREDYQLTQYFHRDLTHLCLCISVYVLLNVGFSFRFFFAASELALKR